MKSSNRALGWIEPILFLENYFVAYCCNRGALFLRYDYYVEGYVCHRNQKDITAIEIIRVWGIYSQRYLCCCNTRNTHLTVIIALRYMLGEFHWLYMWQSKGCENYEMMQYSHTIITRIVIHLMQTNKWPWHLWQIKAIRCFRWSNDHTEQYRVNSSPPSAAYMSRWTEASLVQIMACRLGSAKPLCEPIFTCC